MSDVRAREAQRDHGIEDSVERFVEEWAGLGRRSGPGAWGPFTRCHVLKTETPGLDEGQADFPGRKWVRMAAFLILHVT